MQNGNSTPDDLIDEVYRTGKDAGLKYIYVGNVWNDERENTYCPKCNNLIIERQGYSIKIIEELDKCPRCKGSLDLKLS